MSDDTLTVYESELLDQIDKLRASEEVYLDIIARLQERVNNLESTVVSQGVLLKLQETANE